MSSQEIERTTLELVQKLETSGDANVVLGFFRSYAETLGFKHATCLKVPEAGEDLTECILHCTYPSDWVEHYRARGYLRHDPIVRELFRTYQPYTWSEVLARGPASVVGQQVLNEAAEIGVTDGFVVPIYESSGYTGFVSLGGKGIHWPEECRRAITLGCVYLHNKLSTLKRQQCDNDVDLTERELDCLSWAAAGKSDWEIGQILNVSSKTVNYHIENAKRKFGVTTRIQAIITAMRRGKLAY